MRVIKAVWKGALSFGLVNVPVAVYPAIEPKIISFKELHKDCGLPLQHKRWCPKHGEVEWENVVKGFEISKERYIVVTKEDLEAAKLKSTKNIEIVQFINKDEIEPLFYELPYYLAPLEGGEKAFFLLKEILNYLNKVAIAKVVMRNREYLVAIYPYKKGLVMHSLHYSYEVRDIGQIEELNKKVSYSAEEKKLAVELVKSLSSNFDISKFKDSYAEALKQILLAKLKGEEIKAPKEKVETAKSLIDALKASVEKKKKK